MGETEYILDPDGGIDTAALERIVERLARLEEVVGRLLPSMIHVGTGTPEGNVVAGGGAIYLDRNGQLYVKEAGGTSDTGWTGK